MAEISINKDILLTIIRALLEKHYVPHIFDKCRRTDGRRTKTILKPHLNNRANNVTSRVFTRKTAPSPGETNVLTKFYENWAKNSTSRVFTCFHYTHIEKTAPPTGGHIFSPIWTFF
ncbi:hypothetical protein DPMN_156282 [Dreissena polymorpha]|uniref:Uncharacterized protein n=1 Tax=Dreissena polymorpha TaxID=45954 RepID=A0A9D4FS08_DREPO|nr:hypothetical protein DPMN_156282 [Dreissena polymorpha]